LESAQALIHREWGIGLHLLDRMRAVVEAATGSAPRDIADLVAAYRALAERAYRLLVVLHREDEPEPTVLDLRCLEPRGPVERARGLGLLLEAEGRRCVVYPG